jgi:hypothetical protein
MNADIQRSGEIARTAAVDSVPAPSMDLVIVRFDQWSNAQDTVPALCYTIVSARHGLVA